MKVETIHMVS